MLFSIDHARDPYTLEAGSFAVALCALSCLGREYGLTAVGNDFPVVAPTHTGTYPPAIYTAAGVTGREGLRDRLVADASFAAEVAAALESIRIGVPTQRPAAGTPATRATIGELGRAGQRLAASVRAIPRAEAGV